MDQVGKKPVEEADPKSVEDKDPKVVMLHCFPGINPNHLELVGREQDAVVIISYATGCLPDNLAPAIKKLVDSGCPVFLLSDNRADDFGILNDGKYAAQIPAREAGAISLQKVNINQLFEVEAFIHEQIKNGSRGAVLSQIVKTHYALKPGDKWYKHSQEYKEDPAVGLLA